MEMKTCTNQRENSSLEYVPKSGILSAVGAIAAQSGEAHGKQLVAQRQVARDASAAKSKPVKPKAAQSVQLKPAIRKNVVEFKHDKLSLLPADVETVDLTNSISKTLDRDLGYLVIPRRTTKSAIFSSTKSHRRVLRDNPKIPGSKR